MMIGNTEEKAGHAIRKLDPNPQIVLIATKEVKDVDLIEVEVEIMM